jgi:hypothetical protein
LVRKNSVTAENLAALGAERLAALMMELSEIDPSVRKRLVLALAERGGSAALVKAIDRRLTALANAYSDIAWEREKAYAMEIDGLRSVITQSLAPQDAAAAAERLVRLIRLAPKVFERVDDSNGRFGDIFRAAVEDLGAVWSQIGEPDGERLAEEALALIVGDRYGVCDELVTEAAPALGAAGLAALARRAREALDATPRPESGRAFDWTTHQLRQILGDIADARGDVDAFVSIRSGEEIGYPDALAIASRLIGAHRASEALAWLEKAQTPTGARRHPMEAEREALRIDALEQLGRRAEAQEVRWRLFEQTLSVGLLRAYLRALPDFEDDAALDRAFDLASRHPSALGALTFLTQWPNLAVAARSTMDRASELDGRDYHLLNVAAGALSDTQPLAATVIHRRMIDSVLERAASNSYVYAAKNLAACAQLDDEIDWSQSAWPSHAAYVADLQERHGRKRSFWSLVKS